MPANSPGSYCYCSAVFSKDVFRPPVSPIDAGLTSIPENSPGNLAWGAGAIVYYSSYLGGSYPGAGAIPGRLNPVAPVIGGS